MYEAIDTFVVEDNLTRMSELIGRISTALGSNYEADYAPDELVMFRDKLLTIVNGCHDIYVSPPGVHIERPHDVFSAFDDVNGMYGNFLQRVERGELETHFSPGHAKALTRYLKRAEALQIPRILSEAAEQVIANNIQQAKKDAEVPSFHMW